MNIVATIVSFLLMFVGGFMMYWGAYARSGGMPTVITGIFVITVIGPSSFLLTLAMIR